MKIFRINVNNDFNGENSNENNYHNVDNNYTNENNDLNVDNDHTNENNLNDDIDTNEKK